MHLNNLSTEMLRNTIINVFKNALFGYRYLIVIAKGSKFIWYIVLNEYEQKTENLESYDKGFCSILRENDYSKSFDKELLVFF